MKRFITIVVSMLASVALATAATASASAATVPVLAGGPVALKKLGRFSGYKLVVVATTVAGRTIVAVELVRAERTAVQTTVYSFGVPRSAVSIAPGLRRATIDTRSAMGRFGRIRLTFACRRRAPGHPRSPCLGSGRARSGTLTGVLDVRTELGSIRARSLAAKLAVKKVTLPSSGSGFLPGIGQPSIGRPNCRQYPHAAVLAVAPGTRPDGSANTLAAFLAVRQGTGPMQLFVAASRQRPPATETAALQEPVRRSVLTLVGVRSARFRAAGLPFMHGVLSFTRTAPLPGCTTRAAVGIASGTLRARFDVFGPVPLVTSRPTAAILIGPRP